MNRLLNKVFKFVTIIVITLACGEIGVRAYTAVQYPHKYGKWNIVEKVRNSYRPFRTFGSNHYVSKNDKLSISSRHREHYPFKKDKDTYRIVCLGGSTTENLSVFRHTGKHYPLLLQERLSKEYPDKNIEVINVGNSSYTTAHSLILLELDVISWNPDLVILSHNYNDLATGYWDDEFRVDYSHKFLYEFYNPIMRLTTLNVILQNSALYSILWEKFSRFRVGPKQFKEKSRGELPSEISMDVFKRNLQSFIAISKANNIDVILGSQPLNVDKKTFERFIPRLPYNKIITWPLFSEFVLHHNQFNTILDDIAQRYNVWYVDNHAYFNHERKLFRDPIHYKQKGVQKLAQSYSSFIIENKIVK